MPLPKKIHPHAVDKNIFASAIATTYVSVNCLPPHVRLFRAYLPLCSSVPLFRSGSVKVYESKVLAFIHVIAGLLGITRNFAEEKGPE